MLRSLLFLPGNKPNMLIHAATFGADAVIFDLEDAVSPSEKDAARILVRNTMRYGDFSCCAVIVRINGADTPFWKQDLDTILPEGPSMILLPKAAVPASVQEVSDYMSALEKRLGFADGAIGLMPLIETALGVENSFAIASLARVRALFLGAEDLTADLRCKRTKEGREIEYARQRLVVAARATGKEVFDTPFTDVSDDEGIYEDAALAKSFGFTGKAAISPRHVEAINETFCPTVEEIEYAYEVISAMRLAKEQGLGAVSLRGKMIDAPIVARAEQTVAAAKALGLHWEDCDE